MTSESDFDALIDAAEPDAQLRLRAIAAAIADHVPDAQPCVSYRMPAYRLKRVFIYFAAFKRHIGMYPPLHDAGDLKERLAPHLGPKGNLTFSHAEPLPLELILQVAERLARQAER